MIDPSTLKPGTPVRLKPLEECDVEATKCIYHSGMAVHFGGPILVVDKVGKYGDVFKDSESGWWFKLDWIAEVLPAEEVPRIKPMPYDEMQNWYNPETHKLVPVEEYVGPEEFAELKRKAAEYDRIASLRFIVSTPDAHQSADMLAQMQSGNVVPITHPTFRCAITPTPGAPDLEELIQASQELAPWMSAAIDDPNSCQEFKDAALRFINAVGPILPPTTEVQG